MSSVGKGEDIDCTEWPFSFFWHMLAISLVFLCALFFFFPPPSPVPRVDCAVPYVRTELTTRVLVLGCFGMPFIRLAVCICFGVGRPTRGVSHLTVGHAAMFMCVLSRIINHSGV